VNKMSSYTVAQKRALLIEEESSKNGQKGDSNIRIKGIRPCDQKKKQSKISKFLYVLAKKM